MTRKIRSLFHSVKRFRPWARRGRPAPTRAYVATDEIARLRTANAELIRTNQDLAQECAANGEYIRFLTAKAQELELDLLLLRVVVGEGV